MAAHNNNKKDKGKDSENVVHAMVVTSQKIVELMGRDLSSHFYNYKVSLINIAPAVSYGPDAMTLVLEGKHSDIKKSLSCLKKVCMAKEAGLETTPVKSLPPILKDYLHDMEDEFRFEKIFEYCSKEYLEYCRTHKIKPHPEVVESLNG